MNKTNVLIGCLILLMGAYVLYDQTNRPKTGYIILENVFDGFDLKKDLSKKFENTKNARQKVLDSLAISLKMLAQRIDANKASNQDQVSLYNFKREEYYQRTRQFEQDNQALSNQYDKEILVQLNQYVKDYGNENGYEYILGNDGNGSLMFGTESKNITQPIIEYINSKYKGLK